MQKFKLLTSLILVLTFSTTSCAKKVDETASTKTEVETSVETKVDKEKIASETTDSPSSKLDYLPQLLEDQGLDYSDSAGESAELTEVERKRLIATAKILRASRTNIPNPGPFKLVELEGGSEVWQSRGDLGEFGGTLTVSVFGGGPKTFNVWAATDVPSKGPCFLMFDRLLGVDAWTGEIYPRLAKKFTVSENKLEYTVTLRKGLRWSDGKPLTADDVEFTFNTIVKNGFGNSSLRDILTVKGQFPEVTKVDDLTVSFKVKEPFAPFLYGLYNVPIAPKHKLQEITKKEHSAFHGFWDINSNPEDMVFSGPFKLKRYVPGQRIELVRNSRYSMVDKHGRTLPYLDKMIEVIVPDQNTQLLKFYGEELDFLDIRSVRGYDAAIMKQREKTGNYTMYNLGPDDGTTFMIFNMNRRKDPESGKPYVDPVKQKWFNNIYFRQAVSHAIDRQKMVDNLLKGVGIPIYAHYSAGSLWYNSKLKHYGQDLNLAKSLLKKGGFNLKNNILFDKDGNKVEFVLVTNAGNTARDAACVMIQNQLKELGIKVSYQPIDFNILINSVNNKLDWEAVIMGLTGNKIEPYDSANVWKSDGRLHMFDQRLPDEKGNIKVTDARAWEKEIDKCFNFGATTFDIKKRHQYYDRFQEIAYEKLPFIYLYSELDISSARNSIGNYKPTPLGISYPPKGTFHNIEEIYKKDGGK